jgi:hypothetical protein
LVLFLVLLGSCWKSVPFPMSLSSSLSNFLASGLTFKVIL